MFCLQIKLKGRESKYLNQNKENGGEKVKERKVSLTVENKGKNEKRKRIYYSRCLCRTVDFEFTSTLTPGFLSYRFP